MKFIFGTIPRSKKCVICVLDEQGLLVGASNSVVSLNEVLVRIAGIDTNMDDTTQD